LMPMASELRAWQRFVADNLEFRLGVAIGAVVSDAWSEGAATLALPSLADWKKETKLPWFGFWARELLRWGTHDPFTAFCLSQGLAQTREGAFAKRPEFYRWLEREVEAPTAEDRIDPQRLTAWRKTIPIKPRVAPTFPEERVRLVGTDGSRGEY
ncbi:hypothetical protein, partial [Corallococcus praedator]|uniref:hypothetical protein n=1 Tax=Corallococcus praedator TaxID=2316724 RepID=UPI001ABF2A9B